MESSVMLSAQRVEPVASKPSWPGRILSGLAVAFLLFDGVMKVPQPDFVQEAFNTLGYPAGLARGIGLLLIACVAVHANPRTSFVGAVLLTGYLGGAVATHVRVGNPLFSHVLFPVYVAAMIWGGLYLREPRLRALLAPRK
ncbi:MAG: DoxX family protein [Minicystis sp.]